MTLFQVRRKENTLYTSDIKTHKLQDPHEKEYVNCDQFLKQIFQTEKMKFAEIPQKLNSKLNPPHPVVIKHIITVEDLSKKTACYDIDVEVILELIKCCIEFFIYL